MTSDISEIIYSSIRDGTRLIDTAAVYGSEQGVGKGIKKAIKEQEIPKWIFDIQPDRTM